MRPLVIAIAVALCAACNDTPTSPTSTTTTVPATTSTTSTSGPLTENFELLVPRGGDAFYSFSLTQAGDVKIGLMSETLVPSPAAVSDYLRIGVGTPVGEGCLVDTTVAIPPMLVPQYTVSTATGVHCIDVADPGTLPSAALVSIRYTHP